MKHRTKRVLAAIALSLSCIGATVLTAAPAHAANGWVYIAFPIWLGNCPGGGKVVGLNVATDLWSVSGDMGDDLVYGQVRLNQRNNITATVYCRNRMVTTPTTVTRSDVVPTRNNQTVFVGPAGWDRN